MRRSLLPLAPLVAVLAVGCGSSSSGSSHSSSTPAPATAAEFPSAAGKTLTSLRGNLPDGIVLSPSTPTSIEVGRNRLGFALFTVDRRQISDAQVAVYTTDHDGRNVRGPYIAHWESMAVKPQFRSKTTASDPLAGTGVYVADVPVPTEGKRVFTGIARIGGKLVQTSGFEIPVPRPGDPARPVDVGQKAPKMHTLTLTDAHGDASKIDTRVPPATDLLQVDYADVLGKKPIVLTFATPQLCQSRTCGPVVDVVDQVKAQTKGDVAFIHQEIYNENDPNKGYRSQLAVYRLASEPWTYLIGKNGRVEARFEGAVGVDELQRAVDRLAART